MDEQAAERLAGIEGRIDQMEARLLAALEGRMNGLESRLFPSSPPASSAAPPAPAPVPPPPMPREAWVAPSRLPSPESVEAPPVIETPSRRPFEPVVSSVARTEGDASPRFPVMDGKKAELQFGKVALPLLGAGLLALAMIYLAGELIKRGVLTPPVQFALCILATAALLGIGLLVERKEKTPGQLLIGLGALGGYLTAGAGHSTFHLYTDRAALVAFFVWAMGVLSFGFVRTSKPFAFLGLAGGLIAAIGARNNPEIAFALSGITFVVAGAMAMKHRWPDVVGWTYALATVALAVIAKGQPSLVVVALMEAAAASAVLMRILKPSDRYLSSAPAASGTLFAWIYAAYYGHLAAGWPAALLALWGLGAAYVAWKDEDAATRWTFGTIGFISTGLMAPGTLPLEIRTWIWAIAAVVAAGVCILRPSIFTGVLLLVWMATLLLGRADFPHPGTMPDVVFWPLVAVLHVGLLQVYLQKPLQDPQWETGLFLGVSFPLIGMATGSILAAAGLSYKNAATFSLAAAAFSLMAIGFRTDRLGARYAAWAGLAITVGKFIFVDLSEVDVAVRIAALSVIGVVAFLAGAVYQRKSKEAE